MGNTSGHVSSTFLPLEGSTVDIEISCLDEESGAKSYKFETERHITGLKNNLKYVMKRSYLTDLIVSSSYASDLYLYLYKMPTSIMSRYMDEQLSALADENDKLFLSDTEMDALFELHDVMTGQLQLDAISEQTKNHLNVTTLDTTAVLGSLKSKYHSKKFVNLVLNVLDEEIKCHREILASASPRLFQEIVDACEAGAKVIDFDNDDPDIFREILNYIYTGEMTLTRDNCQQMLETAVFYQLPDVVNICILFLVDLLGAHNAVGLRLVAKRLLDDCQHFLEENMEASQVKEAWFQAMLAINEQLQGLLSMVNDHIGVNFTDVSLGDEILDVDALELKELIGFGLEHHSYPSHTGIFWLVMEWHNQDKEVRGQSVPSLLAQVNFKNMTENDLSDIQVGSDVSTWPEIEQKVADAMRDKKDKAKPNFEHGSDPSGRPLFTDSFDYGKFDHFREQEWGTGSVVSDWSLGPSASEVGNFRDPEWGTESVTSDSSVGPSPSVAQDGISQSLVRVTKEGKPDMRYRENRDLSLRYHRGVPLTVKGTPDRRYTASKMASPLTKDGKPDMRFKFNKELFPSRLAQQKTPTKPLTKDGKLDKRFNVNRELFPSIAAQSRAPAGHSSQRDKSVPGLPVKNDGTPDMRFKANREPKQPEARAQNINFGNITTGSAVSLKKDGTPDRRFRENRSSPVSNTESGSGSTLGGHNRSFLLSTSSSHLKKDGTPDMRYRESRSSPLDGACGVGTTLSGYSGGLQFSTSHLKKDGTPDKRYSENKSPSIPNASSCTFRGYGGGGAFSASLGSRSYGSSCSGPLKRDGTPDMRYKANRK